MSDTANATMRKFGFPATVVADYDHWTVQLRPKQATLGSLIVICKTPAAAFHQIGAAAFVELERVVSDVERALQTFCQYEKINWLMLMMVDPDVHFHVLPRYASPKSFAGTSFADEGWPGPPDLKKGVEVGDELRAEIVPAIKTLFEKRKGE